MAASTGRDETVSSKKETYERQLAKLECPFTWNMDEIDKSINTEYNPHDEEESIPILKVLRAVMTVFMDAKDDVDDVDSILVNLKKCDDDYEALKTRAHPEISTKVVCAVVQATKCFVYYKLNMVKELEELLKNLGNMNNLSDKEKSTLLACKSICWSKYHRVGSSEAEEFIRKAIKLNGQCDVWHFILGKNIRRQRRDFLSISTKPGLEERTSFLQAYAISKNPIYGIFVAQMYRESKEYSKALKMYEDIFKSFDSLSNTILLRLALGFMNQREFEKAKACLDKAEEDCAEHSMYLHYRGIFYMKNRRFAEAARYFKKAIEDNNLPADKQYLECMLKSQKGFNATEYLENMLKRYANLPEKQMQSVVLDLAFSYWNKDNLEQALKHFLHAIEIDPKASCLTNFYNNGIFPIREKNVYVILKKFILPVVDQRRSRLDKETIETVEAIKKFCKPNNEAQMNTLENSLARINIKG